MGHSRNTISPGKLRKQQLTHDTPLQTLITVIIMLIAILEHITTYIKEIPKLAKKTAQAVRSTITKASRNELLQNIKDSYKRATLAVAIATNMMDHTNPNK